jgi:hypothetical protein
MTAHRIEATLSEDGMLALWDLPFRAGDRVEVIVLADDNQRASNSRSNAQRFPLRGTQPYRFDDPFGPAVPEEEWEAMKD